MALTKDRDTAERSGNSYSLPVAAAKKIYAGAIVCIDSGGNATPGAAATGLLCVGRAEQLADNSSGAAGDIKVNVFRGIFRWANSAAGDAIAETDVGELCYIVDVQTVAKTSNVGARSVAGHVFDVDAAGVWVDTRIPEAQRKVYVTLDIADLKAADAAVYRVASPVAGRITKLQTDLKAALVTADATLTGKIGAAAITNGVVTLVQAASAAGQVNVANPTAANAVDVGSDINFAVGGGATTVVGATLTIEITRN